MYQKVIYIIKVAEKSALWFNIFKKIYTYIKIFIFQAFVSLFATLTVIEFYVLISLKESLLWNP